MDEPFGSLDAQTRETMQEELTGSGAYGEDDRLVTHDIDEAVYLGDRVVDLSARPARVREEVPDRAAAAAGRRRAEVDAFLECRNRIWT